MLTNSVTVLPCNKYVPHAAKKVFNYNVVKFLTINEVGYWFFNGI